MLDVGSAEESVDILDTLSAEERDDKLSLISVMQAKAVYPSPFLGTI